ncbi:MAG: LuxR family transcriptional regulator, maltose regulon positive regulatory protein [Solirubrobacteraceae bacterium]
MPGPARSETLLQTKFAVPVGPAATVVRARLFDRLGAGAQHPLTLLAAPAGTGKTSLVSGWIAEGGAPGPVAWLSLDSEDADRHRFWHAVVEALVRSGARAAGSLKAPGRGSADVALPALADAFGEPEDRVVLVLDDFHEVAAVVHDDVERLLRFPPPGLAIVILTRSEPAIGLDRLRLDEGLTEIRAFDLAFTYDETSALVRELGLGLSADDVTMLWTRTEGWAAGLRLAALSLKANADPTRFIEHFAGTDATVRDYLVSEILARQPAELREFLLRTSIVDLLSGELANALTGGSDGHRNIARLERGGALISDVGDGDVWHRYHPLFADLLRTELRFELGQEADGLHRRAAAWLAAHGDDAPALQHAAAAGAWDLAAELAAASWLRLLVRGEMSALAPVLDGMPGNRVDADPELALAFAGALLENGDYASAEPYLRRADHGEAQVPTSRRAHFAAARDVAHLCAARVRGEPDVARAAAHALMDRAHVVEGAGAELRSLALGNLGIIELWTGDLVAAAHDLERAHAAAVDADCDWLVLVAAAHLAVLAMFRSEHPRAARRADEARAVAERRGWTAARPAALAFGVAAGLSMQRGRLAEAGALLDRAEEALRGTREQPLWAVHAFNRALLLADSGECAEGLDVLRAGRAELGSWPLLAPMAEMIAGLEGLLQRAIGEREAAHETLERAQGEDSSLTIATAVARLRLVEGDPAAARTALAPFLEDGSGQMLYFRAAAWLLEARALDALAEPDAAARSLERALDLADAAGLERLIVEYGSAVRPLLHRQLRTGTAHAAFVSDALTRIDQREADGRLVPLLPGSPLSERQQAILGYLPTMMSNQEIAEELSISVNTVKTHLKAIYRKLDAPGRREAVLRARDLGLMS